MLIVLTYDLNDGWGEVKDAAFEGPFFNVISTTMGDKQAPNTTLFANDISVPDAIAAFDRAVATATTRLGRKITVEKLFAARAEDCRLRSDGPK